MRLIEIAADTYAVIARDDDGIERIITICHMTMENAQWIPQEKEA